MKVVSSDDKVTVFSYDIEDSNINDYIKKMVLKLKKKYRINISGFYQINVYKNRKVGMIIDIIKEDDMDYFNDLVDLKIKVYNDSDVYFSFDDYFFSKRRNVKVLDNKYYIDIEELSNNEFVLMTEFCNYVYGEQLSKIKNRLLVYNSI